MGEAKGTAELPEEIFNVVIKPEVVHEVFTAQEANARQSWADTKKRGEVSGGGKKPWPQKGTGRARHGSIRSPIWKGGGVAFGPLSERNYSTKINRKKKQLALKMVLTDKLQNNQLCVLEDFAASEVKTKTFVKFLKIAPLKSTSWLVLTPGKDANVLRMTNNIPKVKTELAKQVNVSALLQKQGLILSKAALAEIVALCIKPAV